MTASVISYHFCSLCTVGWCSGAIFVDINYDTAGLSHNCIGAMILAYNIYMAGLFSNWPMVIFFVYMVGLLYCSTKNLYIW